MQNQQAPAQESEFLIGLKREQLEGLPWAITKVNRQGVFTYGNRAMCELVGGADIEGKTLADVFRGTDLAVVREHFESRFSRRAADEYEVGAVRLSDGVRIPVRCTAVPDVNDRGEVVGTIAIVRDLLGEDVSGAVHHAAETLRDSRQILQAVARECERIVPFDIFGVTRYSEDEEHSRILYLYPEAQLDVRWRSVRWREMSDYDKKIKELKQPINVTDFEELFEPVIPRGQRQSRGRYGGVCPQARQGSVLQVG
jgi:PAS domain S-box-containing protein